MVTITLFNKIWRTSAHNPKPFIAKTIPTAPATNDANKLQKNIDLNRKALVNSAICIEFIAPINKTIESIRSGKTKSGSL